MTDLDERTLITLDWDAVLHRLAHHARTELGAESAVRLECAADREAVLGLYQRVQEVQDLEESGIRMPIGTVVRVDDVLARADHGQNLEGEELARLGRCLGAMEGLKQWLNERVQYAPGLVEDASQIVIDAELAHRLTTSFDERGELSEDAYPELGQLRRQIRSYHQRIQETLDTLVKGSALAGVLQDRYVTQRGDRYVLPIKAEAKRAGLGIVHDTSGSGETVFIEPAAVVELNNKLKVAEGDLRRATARILAALSALVARFVPQLWEAVQAAVQIDLCCARADLGRELQGRIPEVGRGGCIRLKQGRHPVLQLRGIDVIPNTIGLDHEQRGLILSGPNTGGKTVALKMLGLAALFVRAGIPFPADEGSRIDVFDPVIADIGDLQSVEGDLSTFSGHVVVLKAILRQARPGCLVLLDEVAVGTDPAQGAALARAVLEQVVEAGARLAVTTHYTDLKAFAETDPRFANGAVSLEDGRPCYRLELGAVGLSHAFRIARGLGLDGQIVDRAEALMNTESRQVGELLLQLEDQRVAAEQVRLDLERRSAQVIERESELQAAWDKVHGKSRQLAEREAEGAISRVRELEDQVRELVAMLQANPDLKRAGRTLQQIREAKARLEVPKAEPIAVAPSRPLKVGDRVRVRSVNKSGSVVSAPRKGRVEVNVGGLKTRVKVTDCELLQGPKPKPKRGPSMVPSRRPVEQATGAGGVRTDRNTCDLRGKRVDESLDEVDTFLDRMLSQSEPIGWILHGHGTGALKTAVRRHLRERGLSSRPANSTEGGDAFTRVEV